MCLKDLLAELHSQGIEVSESRIRGAIRAGKITRPPLDGSLRFSFGEQHVEELAAHFRATKAGVIA